MPLRDEMRVARCRSRWVAGAWPWGRAGRPCERSAIKAPFEIHDRGHHAPPVAANGSGKGSLKTSYHIRLYS